MRRRCRSADAVALTVAEEAASAPRANVETYASDRAACSGSSRWSKSRLRAGVAYGPVSRLDVPSLFEAGFLSGRASVGARPVAEMDWMRRQTRVTFARVGHRSAVARRLQVASGLAGVATRAGMPGGADIVADVTASGLRGRGGARLSDRDQVEDRARRAGRAEKYIVCNADEGDPGTFADRMLMEGDPSC